MQRCSKRSLTYCPNRTEHRHDVCGEPEHHDVPGTESGATIHRCAWCAREFVQAQTSEGGR